MSDNELIARFMEFPYNDPEQFIVTDYSGEFIGERPGTIDDLKYDTSWDWLMPVVEKIEQLGYYPTSQYLRSNKAAPHFYSIVTVGHQMITDQLEDVKINACYKAVVEFIKWYNDQKGITNSTK